MSASTLSNVSPVRTFDATSFSMDQALAAKASRTVSVCVPCKNEGATIGALVHMLRTVLVDGTGLVDELIVLDDNSIDDTAAVATINNSINILDRIEIAGGRMIAECRRAIIAMGAEPGTRCRCFVIAIIFTIQTICIYCDGLWWYSG